MSESLSTPKARSGEDFWVAVGVVAVLAALSWAVSGWAAPAPTAVPGLDAANLKGDPIDGSVAHPPYDAGKTPVAVGSAVAQESRRFKQVTFDLLAGFIYNDPNQITTMFQPAPGEPAAQADQIPATIQALDTQEVAVQGFMYPLKVDGGSVKAFWLMRNQSLCCFGQVPRLNELVFVQVKNEKGVEWYNDAIVTVYGKLEVGEKRNKDGIVTSLYRMETETVEGPLDL
ncbi:MAG: hypothetical protein AMXMBFR7_10200 [Planctomycetota bacterium]